ncbi:MAG: ParB/RepB/Spo0J family partition protein [Alphaproteobacteria bacterium]|nr:ParB/RepB/Spo0J family partition protein [Alphaproteobacteria bacterium]
MVNKNLGRGLSAFLTVSPAGSDSSSAKIAVNQIHENPYQPRQTFDEEQLEALAASIKRRGVLQPLLVQKINDDSYQLIAGERRLRAAKIAGLEEVPVVLVNFTNEEQLEVALLENIQRENLNPIEEAEGYKRLIDEFNHTQEELSSIVGKSRSHISNMMRLLTLPKDVQQMVKDGKLSFGHARSLIGAENVSEIAHKITENSLNVRETEDLVREIKSRFESADAKRKKKQMRRDTYSDPEIERLERQLSSLLSAKASVILVDSGCRVEIQFDSFEGLDKFVQKLNR